MSELSLEVRSLVEYIRRSGVPFRVTATLGRYVSPANPCSPHSPGSYHCKPGTDGSGLAVDLAEPVPSHDTPGLLRIFAAFGAVESNLAEALYYDAPYTIKNGKRVNGFTAYGRTVMEHHRDHVHIAVPLGTLLVPKDFLGDPPRPGVRPMYDPPLGPIAAVWQDATGNVLAAVSPDGDVYAWGCTYAGGVRGRPYWGSRKAARIGPPKIPGKVYCITATDGGEYNLPE